MNIIQRFCICGSALGLTFLLLAMPVHAFEPMPPIMRTLLEVFPEENGRFVDEPFGSTAEMPAEARPLFETFRVVVPGPDDIEKNLARLFTASSHFRIKKITRYDQDPGAPGLTGFRGVWCQTEDKDQVGFSIVTINQNRFLIWAKMGYYPAFGNDSINPKVRDQYARDVSQYLAGIDMKVPDNEAPEASGRGLPRGMALIRLPELTENIPHDLPGRAEVRAWGLHGIAAFCPSDETMDTILRSSVDKLWPNQKLWEIQLSFEAKGVVPADEAPVALDSTTYYALKNGYYAAAVDRYGRIRIAYHGEQWSSWARDTVGVPVFRLFPATPVLSAAEIKIVDDYSWPRISEIRLGNSNPYVPTLEWRVDEPIPSPIDDYLETFGHFFRALELFLGRRTWHMGGLLIDKY